MRSTADDKSNGNTFVGRIVKKSVLVDLPGGAVFFRAELECSIDGKQRLLVVFFTFSPISVHSVDGGTVQIPPAHY
jgi:hypothetical protein